MGLPTMLLYSAYNTPSHTHASDRMRTNIVLNEELVAQGFALTGLRTKRELVELALTELVRQRRKRNLFDLAGKVSFRPDYDHKALRALRDHTD